MLTPRSFITADTSWLGGQPIGLYTFGRKVEDIVGTAVDGTYSYSLVVYDSSVSHYSVFNGEFQLYTSGNFSDRWDVWDDTLAVDAVQIADDASAASNLDKAFDAEIDSSVILDLKQLRIVGSGGVEAGMLVRGNSTVPALLVETDSPDKNAALFHNRHEAGIAVEMKALAGGSADDGAGLEISGGGGGISGGAGSFGNGLHVVTDSNDSPGIRFLTQSSGSIPLLLRTDKSYGILLDSKKHAEPDQPEHGEVHPGLWITSGDSAAMFLNADSASFDTADFSIDWKRMVGHTVWSADTNNAAWNDSLGKFGAWNAKAQKP
jgi:hypothetical protein